MAKVRLYTLAKEFGMASKELLNKLRANGILVKSALSTVDDNIEEAARRIVLGPEYLAQKKAAEEAKLKAAEEEKKKAAEAKRQAQEEAKRKADEAARAKREAAKKKAEEQSRKRAEAAKEKAAAEAAKKAAAEKVAAEDKKAREAAEKAAADARARAKAEKFAVKPTEARAAKSKPKEKKRNVKKTQAATSFEPVRDETDTQPKVTIIRADRKPDENTKEIDRAIEEKNKLLDIEESIQRRMGKSDAGFSRKRIVRVGAEERPRTSPSQRGTTSGRGPAGGRAPAPAKGRGSRSGPSRPHGGGRRGPQQQRNAPPVGRRGRYKKKKMARIEARMEAEVAEAARERQTLRLSDTVTVSDLGNYMGVRAVELVKKLMGMGVMASVNQRIDFDTATLLAEEYDFKVEQEADTEEDLMPPEPEHDPSELQTRPPVVTVMGHVDHGKTSLLDAIRSANVVAGESGGITQHIGAYQVRIPSGQLVTFLDTPGHEAFTAMRAHGAQVTDIAILVVAADDGVKPQTIEAISHARAAEVPIIVALNKMDKPGINPDKVYQELSQHGLITEEWGGKTIVVKCSAKQNEGIDDLLEMIVLQSEMMELQACPKGPGSGVIIESRLDKGRGPVATVLVNDGVISVGDSFVAGSVAGRVRAMEDHRGQRVEQALPAQPVEIMGFDAQPDVADPVRVVETEQQARQIAEKRSQRRKKAAQAVGRKPSLEELLARARSSEKKSIPVVLRADVVGSVAAVREALEKLTNEEGVTVNVIFSGTGTITESDVMFASASGAMIVGFHVRPPASVQQKAQDEGIEIRLYSVIYKAIEDMEDVLNGMLKPKMREVVIGTAEVRTVFTIPKVGRVAGSYVSDGMVARNAECRLIRDGVEKYLGKIMSLRRFKDDAKEVQAGYECGIRLENYQDVQEGDIIEAFRMEEVPRD